MLFAITCLHVLDPGTTGRTRNWQQSSLKTFCWLIPGRRGGLSCRRPPLTAATKAGLGSPEWPLRLVLTNGPVALNDCQSIQSQKDLAAMLIKMDSCAADTISLYRASVRVFGRIRCHISRKPPRRRAGA